MPTMKDVSTNLSYPAIFNPAEEGGYDVSFPDFPGCVTQGETFEEAQQYAAEVLELWIEQLVADGQPIPRHPKPPIMSEVEVELPVAA
jgi:predicted RNase H-like HicB family nuclease